MNNIEELKAAATAMRLSSTMRITDEIITFRRLSTPDCILNLIAQLEAAQKELSAANEKLSKPVVLPDYRCSPDMHTKQYYETIGFNLGLDACKAVIKTAGFTVEGNADAE